MPWNSTFDEDEFDWPIVVEVNVDYLLDLPINGKGGWQDLLEDLKDWVNEEEETMELDVDDVETILRYHNCYRTGGFQKYLSLIFPEDEPWSFSRFHWCDNVGNEGPFDNS